MIVAVALAICFGLGVDIRRLLLVAAAVYLPIVIGTLIGIHWLRSRVDDSARPALFCEGVASELRAGATLREALATAATSVVGSPASSEWPSTVPMTEVAARVAGSFPSIGDELKLTIMSAFRSGSDSAALFDEIGSLAIAQAEIRREVRIATAPGRATALVLVGAPLIYVATRLRQGGLAELVASPQQRVVALIGLGLFLIGALTAVLVLWRATR